MIINPCCRPTSSCTPDIIITDCDCLYPHTPEAQSFKALYDSLCTAFDPNYVPPPPPTPCEPICITCKPPSPALSLHLNKIADILEL